MTRFEIFASVLLVLTFSWVTPLPWGLDAFAVVGAIILALSWGRTPSQEV